MKTGIWSLIFAFVAFVCAGRGGLALADATSVSVSTAIVTSLHTSVSVRTLANGVVVTATQYTTSVQTNISTNTHIQISTATAHQLASEQNTQDLNNQGANSSTMLGMAGIAAGSAMVAKGQSMLGDPATAPAGQALISAGMQLIMQGLQALAAAGQMNHNAGIAGGYASNLTGTTGNSAETGNIGQSNTPGIQIDPALLHSGKIDGIMNDMENQTGMSREDLANALNNGQDPLHALANSPALKGNPNATEAKLNEMMNAAKAQGMPTAQETMDKLGLTPADLNMAGGARNLASASSSSDQPLFGAKDNVTPTTATPNTGLKVSSEIQDALDKNGITSRTLFEMIHSRYLQKTATLFGERQKRDATAENPYNGGY